DLLEVKIGGPRQEARHGGLASAGRAPEDERAERARLQHARESAVGTQQMILPNYVSELVGAQLVGKRPRRVALKTGGREQARRALLRARGHGPLVHFTSPLPGEGMRKRTRAGSSTEHDRNLLPAAYDGDVPLPAAGIDDAVEIRRLGDLLIV